MTKKLAIAFFGFILSLFTPVILLAVSPSTGFMASQWTGLTTVIYQLYMLSTLVACLYLCIFSWDALREPYIYEHTK